MILNRLAQIVSRYRDVWEAAREDERRQPSRIIPQGKAAEFLPAVLEIQDAPPSPIGRSLAWTIMLVFMAGIIWSSVGKIDIVAVAQGKVIPSGYSKVIQPVIQQFESGIVAAIHVQDGQEVKKGDVLIELDPTQPGADREKAANEYRTAKLDAARLRALLADSDRFEAPSDADPKLLTVQQQMLRDQLAEYRARLEAAQQLIHQRQAAIDVTKANVERLEATVPIEEQRAAAYKKLLAEKFVSEMDYLQFEQQRIDKKQELEGQRHQLKQNRSALSEAEKNYRVVVSEFKKMRQGELSDAETKANSLAQEVVKASQRTGLQRLVSPIDGVVQQLAIHTVGGVVTPAQQLMIVVPQDHPVEVEAQVENKDVGFVKEGQSVEIKVETFPFTLYGTISGKVLSVSDDAAPIEKVGLVYPARVSLDHATVQVEGRRVNLSPGMAVTVEIKTGQRRLIEFFLSPLLKSVQESARER
jgi:hemolysin D